ncbi:MAG: adenylate/guanylate cyclase domain-containing protein [Treponema sp.]|jgi:adenylate cyclase|nr:adenylate/guanylate cyclase domain-containing protein [Treponema sp.]
MKHWKILVLGLIPAVLFSLFYLTGLFEIPEDRLYDMFLRFRPNRERLDSVVFLDVDDNAIAYNGVFPWPRSVTAEGLLRLKEYGAGALIFDIEFIDKGHQGVDILYLNQGMSMDFAQSFAGIDSVVGDILSAIKADRIRASALDDYARSLSEYIDDERENLFTRARTVARDNDRYLAQAIALQGKSWVTLNLRSGPLEGEQAERRSLAEERFSYPVNAAPDANGGGWVDILPPLPSFAQAALGAGFTNAEIDRDGVRRRICLAQNVQDHWYLQLAFRPLVDYLGGPEIKLSRGKLLLQDARVPGTSETKDIVIPLDGNGRMMLDWPRQDYQDSYRHISFARFSLLDDIEAELERYGRELGMLDLPFFTQFDGELYRLPYIAIRLGELFDDAAGAKAKALEYCAEDAFAEYVERRAEIRALIRDMLNMDVPSHLEAVLPALIEQFSQDAGAIRETVEYAAALLNSMKINLDRYESLDGAIREAVQDRFCILGRVDTGTTDIGSNPFWGEYVNVGSHAVVLDTILSQSFIIPLGIWQRILFTLILVPLFLLVTSRFTPILRAAFGFAAAGLILAASVILFRFTGFFYGPLGTVLAMLAGVIIREITAYAEAEQEKKFYRKAFATYTSEAVADQIARNPSLLQLGGDKRWMSAVFTDVEKFSTIAEKLQPEELVILLNRYLTAMSGILLDNEGTVDKYEGDAIIAFFGAPLEQRDHAWRACRSAVMMKRVEREFNRMAMEERLTPFPLITRIGVNTGHMVAGNMGTEKKMNYTIMGDAVNLAARLEGVNKQYGTWILTSEDTFKETGGRVLARKLDRVRVVGKNDPTRIYEILELMENADPEQRKLAAVFENALDYFEKREWKTAAEGFAEALSLRADDGPSRIYAQRCGEFIAHPPAEPWDGVYTLTQK